MPRLIPEIPHGAAAPAVARVTVASRRGLLGGAVAVLAGAVAPAAVVAADAPHPDAELLAACARFQRAEAEYRRLNNIECAIENVEADLQHPSQALKAATAALQAFSDGDYHEAMNALLSAPEPATPEGLRAAADATWQFYQPDPPERHGMGAMLWTVVCAVAGRPYEGGAA